MEILTLFKIIAGVITGACVGSFVGSFAQRLREFEDKKTTLIQLCFTPSVCDFSGKQLKWFELLPIISFLALRGRSKYTGDKLKHDYLLLELISAVLFGGIVWVGLDSGLLYMSGIAVITTIFLILGYYDYLYWEIPLRFVGPVFLCVILFRIIYELFFGDSWVILFEYIMAAAAGAVGTIAVIIMSQGKGLGGGDVWVMALVGLVGGWRGLVVTFLLSVITGAIAGILKVVVTTQKLKGTMIQFIPFISMALILYLLMPDFWFYLFFPALREY